MILIDNHIEHDIYVELLLGEELTDGMSIKYRTLKLGNVTNYLADDQTEELFTEIDEKIHIQTETNEWMKARIEELESKVADMEDALEECNEADNHDNFDGEQDFYER